MKKPLLLTLFLPVLFALAACSDDNDEIEGGNVTVATPTITATTGTSLSVTSSVTGSTNQVVMKGFCYSVNAQDPTIKDNVVDADDNFSATISGLMGNTTYYIRAYVYGNSRYTYSDAVTATTESLPLDEQLARYQAPTYADNYTPLPNWPQRNQ